MELLTYTQKVKVAQLYCEAKGINPHERVMGTLRNPNFPADEQQKVTDYVMQWELVMPKVEEFTVMLQAVLLVKEG